MIYIKNWLLFLIKSKIVISIEGKNVERFIKRLKNNNINILNIKKISYDKIEIKIYESDYEEVIKIKTIYEISIIEYLGLKRYINSILNNKYIILSIVICFVILYILSNMIFNIEIITNDSLMKERLNNSLKEYGIEKYKFKKDYNKLQLIKKDILSKYRNEIEWIEIEVIGTKYLIKYEPRLIKEETKQNQFRNIVALKDAVIKNMNISSGQIIRGINTYVKKGEIIVSGYIYLNGNIKNTVPAKGDIYGEVWYTVSIDYPYKYNEEFLTGKEKDVFVLKILNKYIEILNFNKYKTKKVIDKTILKNNLLPFKIIKQKQMETVKKEEINNENELIKKAIAYSNKKIENKLKEGEYISDYKILSKTEKENSIELNIFYSIVENITHYDEVNEYIGE